MDIRVDPSPMKRATLVNVSFLKLPGLNSRITRMGHPCRNTFSRNCNRIRMIATGARSGKRLLKNGLPENG